MKIVKRLVVSLLVIVVVLLTSFYIYALDYYKADDVAIELLSEATIIDKNIYFDSDNTEQGIIIYPGAKVEAAAYTTLASRLNRYGFTVVIADFPLRFAFFDIDVADQIMEERPEIESWVIIGHSLGGTMAGYYAADANNIDALVFLASYTTADVNVDSLYIYGSNDEILSVDKVPTDNLYIIEGGNHAGFANYGPQKNDGELGLAKEFIIMETAHTIFVFLRS